MFKPRLILIAIALSGLLAACGGGGGSGGTSISNPPVTPPVTPPASDPMVAALATGNSKDVTIAQIAQSTQSLLSTQTSAYASIKQKLFSGVSNITWNPGRFSSFYTTLDAARNQVILPSNWKYDSSTAGSGVTLAVVGSDATSKTAYAVFGGDPIVVNNSAAMTKLLANTVAWLTPKSATPASFKIVIAHMYHSYEPKQWTWFRNQYSGITINGLAPTGQQKNNLCDGAALDGCLQNADLLVMGREVTSGIPYDGNVVMAAVKSAQSRGIPILYLDDDEATNDLQTRLLSYFGLGQVSNYWDMEGLNNFDPSTLPAVPAQLAGYSDLITRLANGTFTSNWTQTGPNGQNGAACSGGGCSDTTYLAQLGTLGDNISSNLRSLDAAGTVIFGNAGNYELEKRIVLLGDKYRELVSYPLDKGTGGNAPEQDFHRALFSDMTTYLHRGYSSVAQNLGDYSKLFPAGTAPTSQTVSINLPAVGNLDYITSVYVMPGQTVTLTRSDSVTSDVTMGVHKLRNTTHPFDANGLNRPYQISSPGMPLPAGQSVSITSPYGGPLFFNVQAASSGPQTVTIKIDGGTTYPLLRDATNSTQVSNFQSAVANAASTASTTSKGALLGAPNWTAITTEMMTIFSTLDHMQKTINTYTNAGSSLTQMASDTWTYEIKDTYELAGFNSASGKFSLAPAVTIFCTANQWDCTGLQHRRDVMQYVISDTRAACGDGCSGNPYDQDWPFGPLGWGESHEVGHNIQPGRLQIYGGDASGEVSNNIFPVHKHIHYNIANNGHPAPGYTSAFADRSGAGKAAFDQLQGGNAHTVIWGDTSYAANNDVRVMFYRQLAEYARYYNSGSGHNFSDGWELYTLLYLLDRNFDNTSAANWSSVAASYGFGTYSSKPSIDGNDFMLIATSYIIGKDMRSVFDLWGITYSAAASNQVALYHFTSAGALLFPMASVVASGSGVGQPITMTAGATYPPGY